MILQTDRHNPRYNSNLQIRRSTRCSSVGVARGNMANRLWRHVPYLETVVASCHNTCHNPHVNSNPLLNLSYSTRTGPVTCLITYVLTYGLHHLASHASYDWTTHEDVRPPFGHSNNVSTNKTLHRRRNPISNSKTHDGYCIANNHGTHTNHRAC